MEILYIFLMDLGYLVSKGFRLGGAVYLTILIFKLFRSYQVKKQYQIAYMIGFTLGLLCYLLAPFPFHFPSIKYFAIPLLFGAWAAPYFLWLISQILFKENFKPSKKHFTLLMAIETVQFFLFYSAQNPLPHWLYENNSNLSFFVHIILPRLISGAFATMAIYHVTKDRDDDLVEKRREKRNWFILYASLLTLIIVGAESLGYYLGHSHFIESITTILCLVLIYQFTEESLKEDPFWNLKWDIKREQSTDDTKIISSRLQELLANEKIYLSSDINLRKISKALNSPEYKIRKAINQELGFNNFKNFLNHYRIEEAKKILSDPLKSELPIFNLAQDVGFGSLATFNRTFKQIVGIPPSEYRSNNK